LKIARDEAANNGCIETRHILIALSQTESDDELSRAMKSAFETFDLTTAKIRAESQKHDDDGSSVLVGMIPFSRRSRNLIELAVESAVSLKDNHISPGHLYNGLCSLPDGSSAQKVIGSLLVPAEVYQKMASIIIEKLDPEHELDIDAVSRSIVDPYKSPFTGEWS